MAAEDEALQGEAPGADAPPPAPVPEPVPEPVPSTELDRRYAEVEAEIIAWLDEAVEEGAAIIDRAQAEADRLKHLAHEHAERLRLAAERAAIEAARNREQVLLEAQAEATRMQASVSEQIASALREADEQAARRRRSAAEEAASLLAESRATAERHVRTAEEEAEWRLAQAEANAGALEHRAAATVASLQADVGLLQQQLTGLVEHAMALLPALDNASRTLAEGVAAVKAGQPLPEALAAAPAPAEEPEPEPAPELEAPPTQRPGLGQLVPDAELDHEDEDDYGDEDHAIRPRRGLGRLLGRR